MHRFYEKITWGYLCIHFHLFILAILVLPTAPVFADSLGKHPKVTIASFSFPPLLHATVTGEFSGTMGETVKRICEEGGINCDFNVLPLKRAYIQVKNGDVDALITINSGQLNDCCIPSEWSSPWTAGLFYFEGEEMIPGSPKELIGKSLIIVNGMKSPYFFAKDLDKMSDDGRLSLFT